MVVYCTRWIAARDNAVGMVVAVNDDNVHVMWSAEHGGLSVHLATVLEAIGQQSFTTLKARRAIKI